MVPTAAKPAIAPPAKTTAKGIPNVATVATTAVAIIAADTTVPIHCPQLPLGQ